MFGFQLNGSLWLQGGEQVEDRQDQKQREQWPSRWGERAELGLEQERQAKN